MCHHKDGRMLDVYRVSSSYCKVCPLKKNCLSDATPNKQMYRWEHEDIIDSYTTKMNTAEAKAVVKKRLAQQAFVQFKKGSHCSRESLFEISFFISKKLSLSLILRSLLV